MTFKDPKIVGLLAVFVAVAFFAATGRFSPESGPAESGFDGVDPISLDDGVDPTPPLRFLEPVVPRNPFQGNMTSEFSEADRLVDDPNDDAADDGFDG